MQKKLKSISLKFLVITALLAWCFSPLIGVGYAYVTLQSRSIDILTSAGGAITSHTFSFQFAVPVDTASLQFQYCTDPIDDIPCDTPNGLDVSGAVLDSQSGETGFSILSASANNIILTRPLSASGVQLNTYAFSNMKNPSDIGPFFVRISSYTTVGASGAYNAFSSVAASITTGININAEVPPILYFCSAVTIPTDCSDATGDFIDLGTLLTSGPKFATSQFLVGTNAPNGYNISSNGFSMTSGTDQINPVSPAALSKPGFNQFGLNLRANLSPLVGAEMAGGSGAVTPNYNTPNLFRYTDGDIVASGPGPTTFGLYTVSYIVNVASNQPAGVYNTTLTYVCTAGF